MSLIVAENVSRTYRRGAEEVRALDGVTFTLDDGEFAAIVGPSGAGKSTLLQLLGGMDRPTGGRLTVAGKDLATLGDADLTRLRRDEIGFVFQHFGLLPVLTVAENIALPMSLGNPFGGPPKGGAGRVNELLERVGLAHRRNHRPSELSGGEMQRVAIARALVNKPRILLADEPTGNLDSATSAGILDLLTGLNREEGVTLIIVTHNDALAQSARRRIILRDGKIAATE